MKKLPQLKATVGQQQHVSANPNAKTKLPPKIVGEPLAKKTAEVVKNASDLAAGSVDGDRARFFSEDKMEAPPRLPGSRGRQTAAQDAVGAGAQDDAANQEVHQLHGQEDLHMA